jgi:hypothetical protein
LADSDNYGLVISPQDQDDEYTEWFSTLDIAIENAIKHAKCGHYFFLVKRIPFDSAAIRKAYKDELCECI